jgi:hypothetical protein
VWIGFLSTLFFVLVCEPAHAEKTDVVILENSDYLTGEIKELKFGRLRFKTDSMDSVLIEWDEIDQLTSDQTFEIELESGLKLFGSFGVPSEKGKIKIVFEGWSETLDMSEVVKITPIKATFWQRLDGHLSLGFSFTKASEVAQFSFNGGASHRTRKRLIKLDLTSVITRQEGVDDKKNQELSLMINRFLERKWFVSYFSSLEQNDELGTDLRVSLGAGPGRNFIQTNHSLLSTIAGLVATREFVAGSEPDELNLEGVLSINYLIFRYEQPKTDLTTRLNVYPSITSFGRVRSEFDTRLKYEFIKDFFAELSFNLQYDTDPPSAEASNSDYYLITSLGWSF